MSLEEKLAALRAESAEKFPAEVKEIFGRAAEELVESGIKQRALDSGTTAPAFSLSNTEGEVINSQDLLSRGPLVLTIYRGVW